jgi:hypothetical protein
MLEASKISIVKENSTDIDAYTYLRQVWNDHLQPVHVRLRAASIGIEYERPRLAVSAMVSEGDFASLLDARLKRFEQMRVIEGQPQKQIEHQRIEQPIEAPKPLPRVADRRFRRF